MFSAVGVGVSGSARCGCSVHPGPRTTSGPVPQGTELELRATHEPTELNQCLMFIYPTGQEQ